MKNALLSAYNKTGVEDLARFLYAHGYDNLYATQGTAKHLCDAGIAAIDVAEIVGFEPFLDGRVKMISEKLAAGFLALDTPEHRKELSDRGIPWFNFACIKLYPVEQAIFGPNATVQSVMEMTDIGGETIIRACAKGHTEGRIIVCNDEGIDIVRHRMDKSGNVPDYVCRRLAAMAFEVCADYDRDVDRSLFGQGRWEDLPGKPGKRR